MVAFILCGYPGSGKSRLTNMACHLNKDVVVISRDIIRAELGFCNPGEKVVCTKEQEDAVTAEAYHRMEMNQNSHILIDDTNLNAIHRTELIAKLKSLGFKTVGLNVQTPIDVCIERRRNDISEDVMRKIAERASFISESEVDELINYKQL